MDPDITLAGIELEHPLMNAAGTCKTIEDVREFARSVVSAITVGSITVEQREGNAGDVYYKGQGYSLNGLGMPNPGAPYYVNHLADMVAIAHEVGKPLAVSVAGFTPVEYGQLTDLALAADADLVELNLGCPNVWDGGEQKRIASFDPEGINRILDQAWFPDGRKIGVKLSPYSDPGMLAEVAAVVNKREIYYVVACNTFPNAFTAYADGTPTIAVGYGGLSGAAMYPIALGQVRQFRDVLNPDIQIVGAGGIETGQQIQAFIGVGASAVQASTPYWNGGERLGVFSEILKDYKTSIPA